MQQRQVDGLPGPARLADTTSAAAATGPFTTPTSTAGQQQVVGFTPNPTATACQSSAAHLLATPEHQHAQEMAVAAAAAVAVQRSHVTLQITAQVDAVSSYAAAHTAQLGLLNVVCSIRTAAVDYKYCDNPSRASAPYLLLKRFVAAVYYTWSAAV